MKHFLIQLLLILPRICNHRDVLCPFCMSQGCLGVKTFARHRGAVKVLADHETFIQKVANVRAVFKGLQNSRHYRETRMHERVILDTLQYLISSVSLQVFLILECIVEGGLAADVL